jgi:hypothetical protein
MMLSKVLQVTLVLAAIGGAAVGGAEVAGAGTSNSGKPPPAGCGT